MIEPLKSSMLLRGICNSQYSVIYHSSLFLVFSFDSELLAGGFREDGVSLWDVASGNFQEHIRTQPPEPGLLRESHLRQIADSW